MGGFRKHGSKHKKKTSNNLRVKGTRKTAKGDKIHGIKKGAKGIASQYLTRAQTLKKLQLPLADFRKLCILKGIYPRDPKKKPAGADKTYYHIKDVKYMQHEPVMMKLYETKSFMKKYKKACGRKNKDKMSRLEENKPEYTLQHLVRRKGRY
jgi:pescadillo